MYFLVFYPVLPTIPKGVTDCLDTFIGAMDRKSSVEAFDRLQVHIHCVVTIILMVKMLDASLYKMHIFKYHHMIVYATSILYSHGRRVWTIR